jgi:hypothetical protein
VRRLFCGTYFTNRRNRSTQALSRQELLPHADGDAASDQALESLSRENGWRTSDALRCASAPRPACCRFRFRNSEDLRINRAVGLFAQSGEPERFRSGRHVALGSAEPRLAQKSSGPRWSLAARAQTALRSLGIEMTFSREGRTGRRMIRMSKAPENTVSTDSNVCHNGSRSGQRYPSRARDRASRAHTLLT